MNPLIANLDTALASGYPEYHAALGPGSPDEDIDELERVFGLPLPPLYRDFLAWRGPSPDGAPVEAGSLIYNQDLMTAREVIDTVTMMRELRAADPSWITSAWWGEHYLPILDNHAGDNICIDMSGEALLKETRWDEHTRTRLDVEKWTSLPGQIMDFTHDAEFREIYAPDFASWVEAITSTFTAKPFDTYEETCSGTRYIGFDEDAEDHIEAALGTCSPGFPRRLEQQFGTD
ncbi:SMI1/KNR4 family protein [Tsukamurella hominis]|uniref:SMI1/KNR4 family protein n=1 Tax=Tsukamurella hominis TaxID=1970232 RepID=UPI0039EB96BC